MMGGLGGGRWGWWVERMIEVCICSGFRGESVFRALTAIVTLMYRTYIFSRLFSSSVFCFHSLGAAST